MVSPILRYRFALLERVTAPFQAQSSRMARPAVAVRAGDARVPPNRDADRSDADETCAPTRRDTMVSARPSSNSRLPASASDCPCIPIVVVTGGPDEFDSEGK